jgi:hypothetical protein
LKANIPTRLTSRPTKLTKSSLWVFISGGSKSRWIASEIILMEIKTRKTPFANPLNVSTRLYL